MASNNTDQIFGDCECQKQNNCHASTERNVCNCDASPSVLGWQEDKIIITNRTILPIIGFKYGFLRGRAKFSIGKLFCKGGPDPVDIL